VDFLTRQSLEQERAILIAKKIDYECEICIIQKEIERLTQELGDNYED